MIALLLGVAAATLFIWSAQLAVQGVERVHALRARPLSVPEDRSPRIVSWLQDVGARLSVFPGLRSLPSTIAVQRSIGLAVVLCPPLVVFQPALAIVAAAVVVAPPLLRERSARRVRLRAIERDLPMFVDLLHLAVGSGSTTAAAIAYVSRKIEGPISDVFLDGLRRTDQGRRFAEVLRDCENQLGESALALTSVLLSAERYGSPIGPLLAQLAREIRFDQERRTEQAARRLSVQLIFPLAGCILPAFALLTAAPLLAGSIGTLADSFQ